MMDSTLYNQGSCLPPQLPPLPPPPQIFSPPNWMPPYPPIPPRPFFLPPQTPPIIFQSPPRHYYGSGRMFVRGRGRDRGRGGGTSRAGHKGDLQKCTTCDRVYKSEETYLEHMQSHVKVRVVYLLEHSIYKLTSFYIALWSSVQSVISLLCQKKSRNTAW